MDIEKNINITKEPTKKELPGKEIPEGLNEHGRLMYAQILEDHANEEKYKKDKAKQDASEAVKGVGQAEKKNIEEKKTETAPKKLSPDGIDNLLIQEGYLNVPEDAKEAAAALALKQKEKKERSEQKKKDTEEYQQKLKDLKKAATEKGKINGISRVTMESIPSSATASGAKRVEGLKSSPEASIISISAPKKEDEDIKAKKWWQRIFE